MTPQAFVDLVANLRRNVELALEGIPCPQCGKDLFVSTGDEAVRTLDDLIGTARMVRDARPATDAVPEVNS